MINSSEFGGVGPTKQVDLEAGLEADHLALGVMNGILGGNTFSSRILERVRSDEGLAYSAASAFHAGTYYEGTFSVGFQSKSPSVTQAITLVVEEIERLRTTKVGAEELSTAIGHAVEALPLRFVRKKKRSGNPLSSFFSVLSGAWSLEPEA